MQQNTGNFFSNLIARKIHHFFFSFTLVLLMSVSSAWSAGYVCNDIKKYTSCNAGYYLTSTAVGNSCASCPSGWTSDGGTTVGAAASCYKAITINKNGYSGTLTAGSGCPLSNNPSGTTSATLKFYYNTACTLPTISSTYNGYIYSGLSTSNTVGASAITSIAATTTAPSTTTYYVRKATCAANYYKSATTTCATCSSGTNSKYTLSTAGTNGIGACYLKTTAGNYVETAGAGQVTCTGGYCPGGTTVYYDTSVNSTATGGRSTISNWTCPDGASAATQCYRGITLNKNGMSGTLTLPTDSGCKSLDGTTGTTNDTVYVYYNTKCLLPTTVLSATATGTTYTGTGTWASSANASSGFVNYITTTSTSASLVRYAGKMYTCSAGYYLEASTNGACSPCAAGNWCAGISNQYYNSNSDQGLSSCSGNLGTGYTSAGGSGDTANTKCYLPVSAGYIRSGTSGTTVAACAAGKYKGAHNAYYGTSYSCTNVPAGYWNNGCGTNSTGGVCSTDYSGGTIAAGRYGAAGATSAQGSGAVNAGYYSTGGGTSATPTAAGNGCISSKACGKVTAGCYTTSTGSTTECPNECPGDMTSDAGSDAKTDCKISCTAGNYLAKNTSVCATCTKGNYCANDGTYNFNTDSDQGIAACPAGSFCVAGVSGATKCVTGSYSAAGASTCTACQDGKTTSADGATSCNTTCSNATGVSDWEDASWASSNTMTNLCTVAATAGCSENYYKNSNGCATCDNGTGGKYKLSAAGTTSVNSCYLETSAGKYVETKGAGEVDCLAGSYCSGGATIYYGGTGGATTGGRNTCANWTYQAQTGKSSCDACLAVEDGWTKVAGTGWTSYANCKETKTGTAISEYCASGELTKAQSSATAWGTSTITTTLKAVPGAIADKTNQTCTQCPAGYYSAGGTASSCSACYGGTYSDTAGASQCTACPAEYPSGNWAIKSISSCYRACQGGSYMAKTTDTSCTEVGAGYYAAAQIIYYGKTGSRTACPAGTTSAGYGRGADEAGDCGKTLHVGDETLQLRSVKKTTPSLNVKIGDTTFYGNMSPVVQTIGGALSKYLKVNANSTLYYTYDDSARYNKGYEWDKRGFDMNEKGSKYTYDKTAMTWETTFDWGKVGGIAACNTTDGSWAKPSSAEQENTGGTKCWCKMTSPAVSAWVFNNTYSSASICASDCAHRCGASVRDFADFRSGVFGAVGD